MSKPTPDLPFSEPHNWCDRQCERCPLASECEVPKRDLDARVTSEARGEEWDPLDSAVEDTCRDLDAFVERLDIDDDPAGAPPDLLGADRLRSAGGVLMLTFAKGPKPDRRSFALAVITATKALRIATYLTLGVAGAEAWRVDAVPNLLLLERAKGEIRRSLGSQKNKTSRRVAAALADLDEVLDPLIAAIDAGPRLALRALEEGGRAPSPFCVSSGGAPDPTLH